LLGLDLSAGDLAHTLPDAVWRCNAPALIAFLTAATQWNCVGLGEGRMQVIGLRYADTRAALDLAGIKVTPALWGDLRIIERGALGEMNGSRR
jgi:hypothetical protein